MTENHDITEERYKRLVHNIIKKMDQFGDKALLDDPDVQEVFSEVISLDKNFVLQMLQFLRQAKYEGERQENLLMHQIETILNQETND